MGMLDDVGMELEEAELARGCVSGSIRTRTSVVLVTNRYKNTSNN